MTFYMKRLLYMFLCYIFILLTFLIITDYIIQIYIAEDDRFLIALKELLQNDK